MWRDRGILAGENLESRATSVGLVGSSVKAENSRKLAVLRSDISKRSGKRQYYEQLRDAILNRRSELNRRRVRREEEREVSVAGFSLLKGFIYIGLALIFIVADVVLLAEVAAGFFEINLYTTEGGEFRSIYSVARDEGIGGLLGDFWHLFGLTLAVLLTGMFIKVWKDVMDNESRTKRDSRLYTFLLMMAGMALLMMAAARTTVPLGGNDETLGFRSFVSAALGLALPLVGAGFFMKGYDALAGRYRLFRVSMHARLFDLMFWIVQRSIERERAALEGLERHEIELSSERYISSEIETAMADFERGYKEGVERALRSGPLVERLRRAALTNLLGSRGIKLGGWLAALLIGTVVGGCGVQARGSASKAPDDVGAIVFLFDPTAGNSQSGAAIEEALSDATEYLLRDTRLGRRIAFFAINREIYDQRPRVVEFTAQEAELKSGGPEAFVKRMEREIGKEMARFLELWREAHEEESLREAESCLLSGLARVSQYIDDLRGAYTAELIFASDFLEVCDEWNGEMVNLEGGRRAVEAFRSEEIKLSLGGLKKATLVRLPLPETAVRMSNLDRERLLEVWVEILERSKLDRKNIAVVTHL